MVRLRDIAAAISASIDGIPAETLDRAIDRVTAPDEAGRDDLCYVGNDKYASQLKDSRAGVVIAGNKLTLPPTNAVVLRVPDAELAIAKTLALFAPPPARPPLGVHAYAAIDDSATVGKDVAIGAFVSIAAGATIGDGCILHSGVTIGEGATLGANVELHSGVAIRDRVTLGNRVVVHANSVIGTDGFGYRFDGKRHVKVPQIGTVVIEDDVEIGSCTCIDRAKFGETRIGRGTKIDNLVQVGHNVTTGMHCILCGQVAIGGSTTLGNGVVMAGGAAARDHIALGDGVMVAAKSGIGHDVPPGSTIAGAPAVPHRDWLREQAAIRKLPELVKQLRRLEALVAELQAKQA